MAYYSMTVDYLAGCSEPHTITCVWHNVPVKKTSAMLSFLSLQSLQDTECNNECAAS